MNYCELMQVHWDLFHSTRRFRRVKVQEVSANSKCLLIRFKLTLRRFKSGLALCLYLKVAQQSKDRCQQIQSQQQLKTRLLRRQTSASKLVFNLPNTKKKNLQKGQLLKDSVEQVKWINLKHQNNLVGHRLELIEDFRLRKIHDNKWLLHRVLASATR